MWRCAVNIITKLYKIKLFILTLFKGTVALSSIFPTDESFFSNFSTGELSSSACMIEFDQASWEDFKALINKDAIWSPTYGKSGFQALSFPRFDADPQAKKDESLPCNLSPETNIQPNKAGSSWMPIKLIYNWGGSHSVEIIYDDLNKKGSINEKMRHTCIRSAEVFTKSHESSEEKAPRIIGNFAGYFFDRNISQDYKFKIYPLLDTMQNKVKFLGIVFLFRETKGILYPARNIPEPLPSLWYAYNAWDKGLFLLTESLPAFTLGNNPLLSSKRKPNGRMVRGTRPGTGPQIRITFDQAIKSKRR